MTTVVASIRVKKPWNNSRKRGTPTASWLGSLWIKLLLPCSWNIPSNVKPEGWIINNLPCDLLPNQHRLSVVSLKCKYFKKWQSQKILLWNENIQWKNMKHWWRRLQLRRAENSCKSGTVTSRTALLWPRAGKICLLQPWNCRRSSHRHTITNAASCRSYRASRPQWYNVDGWPVGVLHLLLLPRTAH